ncbi:unnamed protein product, partial [Cylindrotheca closterium]
MHGNAGGQIRWYGLLEGSEVHKAVFLDEKGEEMDGWAHVEEGCK